MKNPSKVATTDAKKINEMFDEKFRHAAWRNIQYIGQYKLLEKPGSLQWN